MAAISVMCAASLLASAVAHAQSSTAPPPVSPPASAAPSSDPFSALVGKRRARAEERTRRVKVQRYVLASDNRAFLFEDRSNTARLKFLCGENDPRLDCLLDPEGPTAEIYRVTPTRGPRGDVIYKNAEGDTLLRIASYGGATVFWPGAFEGAAASKSFGDDAALRLAPADLETAQRRAAAATAVISALTGAPIVFDLGEASRTRMASRDGAEMAEALSFSAPPSAALMRMAAPSQDSDYSVLADAVARAAKGLKDVADDPTGARVIAGRIGRVLFVRAEEARVTLEGETLRIDYAPDEDIDGRPSSSAISRFLEETL